MVGQVVGTIFSPTKMTTLAFLNKESMAHLDPKQKTVLFLLSSWCY